MANPVTWPTVWARCWQRARTWRLPPRWAAADWSDEAFAQGALAYCQARREFDPARGVPLEAFLLRRMVAAVWARYRQEWSFGRRARSQDGAGADAHVPLPPEPDLCRRVARVLGCLTESEHRFIRRLFWDGVTLADLSVEMGLTREALKKRKARALVKLRGAFRDEC